MSVFAEIEEAGKVQNVLWGRAAGRCQYAGCNELLVGDQISGAANANTAYIGHIVALRDLGDRPHMMTVETGNSTGSAASPNVPPAAPDAVASARCNNCEPGCDDRGSVRSAALTAVSSPFEVAEAMALDAKEGSA